MNDTTPQTRLPGEGATDSPLFTPVRLGRYDLPNRIVLSPMTRNRSPGGVPNALNARYYAQRASAGLVIVEGSAPHPLGMGYIDMPGIYSDEQVRGWRALADAVHAAARTSETGAGRVFAQVMFVGRVSHPVFLNGETPLAPSAVKAEGTTFTKEGPKPFVEPRAMTEAEIETVLDSYAAAARLAVGEAGLDGVEIHGANGYLPSQFLAPNANTREDAWGGDVPRRARFLLEAVDRAVGAIGADRVGVRLSPGGTFNDIHDPDWPATYAHLLPELDRRGLAYVNVFLPPAAPAPSPDAAAGAPGVPSVAEHVRAHYKGTLILNGGYDRARADADIGAGRADLVGFGTSFLANPDLPARLATGAALNAPDPSTFYGGGEAGYIDYPTLEAAAAA